MPTFATPDPISVSIELGVGDIRIAATDRPDTVVAVRPSDATRKADVTAAQQTRVEYAGGRLLIRAPKGWRQYTLRQGGESIDLTIELPAGSHLRVGAGIAAMRCAGPLGECRYQAGIGDVELDEAVVAEIKTGVGDIAVDRVLDHAELTTSSGAVRVGRIDGPAVIKNSNGDTWIGEIAGDLRVNAANGRISVDHAHAAVAAKTANGDVRLGEVSRGAILAETGLGRLDVGVREGVPAWLDLKTHLGNVQNNLDAAGRPEPGEPTVEVRARSGYGDISIHRSLASHEPARS